MEPSGTTYADDDRTETEHTPPPLPRKHVQRDPGYGRRDYDHTAKVLLTQGSKVIEKVFIGPLLALAMAGMVVGQFWFARQDQQAMVMAINHLTEKVDLQTKATEKGNELLAQAVQAIDKGTDRMLNLASLQASQASVQAALNTQAQQQAVAPAPLPSPPKKRGR